MAHDWFKQMEWLLPVAQLRVLNVFRNRTDAIVEPSIIIQGKVDRLFAEKLARAV